MFKTYASILPWGGMAGGLLGVSMAASAATFTIPESKLLDTEFATTEWGGSVVRSDAPGSSVQFAFSDLTDDGTGLKDDYSVDTVYGQNLPSHGNGDFSNFTGYALKVENLDDQTVLFSLFINTGFTGPSGDPSNTLANDTFWQSEWMEVPSGESRIVQLDFDQAVPWNIQDNPTPHTQGTNGVATSINSYDRTELSAIGFEVRGPGNSEAVLLVSSVPEPASLALLGLGGLAVLRRR